MKIKVKNHYYTIRLVNKVDKKNSWGECSSKDHTIKIKKSLSNKNVMITLIHELLHAIEFELNIPVKHSFVKQADVEIYKIVKQLLKYANS